MKQFVFILLCTLFIFSYNTSIAQINTLANIDYEISINKLINEDDNIGSWCRGTLGIENNEAFIVYGYAIQEGSGYTRTCILAHLNAQGEIINEVSFSNDEYFIEYIGKMDAPDSYLAMGCKQIEEER
ncbi:MAG: hypothetical protein FWC10_10280, partial [Lentimicrobiaceae bacterium]|nr:hypothetical protein [Lentimicrobiaceae bacterium]